MQWLIILAVVAIMVVRKNPDHLAKVSAHLRKYSETIEDYRKRLLDQ